MDCSNEGVALGEFSAVEALAAAFACFRLSVRACFCSFLSWDFDNLGGSVLFARDRCICILSIKERTYVSDDGWTCSSRTSSSSDSSGSSTARAAKADLVTN